MTQHSVLVTGASSGIGKYLAEVFNADIVTRQSPISKLETSHQPYDVIVHCAFNMGRNIGLGELHGYFQDTLGLTETAVNIPHRAFVLLSSIDVYPPNAANCDEDTPLDIFTPTNLYSLCKIASEEIVMRLASNPLILRPGTLLGPYMRQNNLTRLLREENAKLTLTADSSFHCILYDDIATIVNYVLTAGLTGTYNTAFSPAVTLGEVASRFNRTPTYGAYNYHAPSISTRRLVDVFPQFNATSMEVVDKFSTIYC